MHPVRQKRHMNDILRIENKKYSKTNGVFKVPLSDLGETRFCDLPYYSTIEVVELPGSAKTYCLSITATHAGGPDNESFFLNFHLDFWQAGEAKDEKVKNIYQRKLRHTRSFFQDFVDSGWLDDGDGDEIITRFNGKWLCGVLYSRDFTRQDNPVLSQVINPFVTRYKVFLETSEPYLFLCHASEDKEFVDILAIYLDSRGVDLWYDKREIKVGDSIVSRINDGLDAASHIVVVLSKASVEKTWVKKEISAALMKQLHNKSITVIPLLREDCRIPPLLADIRYADCRKDQDTGFQQIVDAIIGSEDSMK